MTIVSASYLFLSAGGEAVQLVLSFIYSDAAKRTIIHVLECMVC